MNDKMKEKHECNGYARLYFTDGEECKEKQMERVQEKE